MIKLPPVVVIELAVTASGKAPVTTYPDESVPRIGASVIVVFRVPVHRTAPEVIELHEIAAGTLNVAPVGATLSATTVAQYILLLASRCTIVEGALGIDKEAIFASVTAPSTISVDMILDTANSPVAVE
ncbi:hypothetical protein PAPYR_12195 [Paratrimastix pyriformis]|uniref:Uncharacterized protein n=1 Tax=Paratrimastix pyriformis TaxID=342808 RepID=A0ABQ8U0G6_9EUKA|nr:hypothetical protein PAPYR_13319 [Paratrimastix pyriformis]KAJ4452856.1 hypothetical protein PAPYR_12862 [Paratrimastix pyriformis]KAJ4452959.1 hypothetical protein PAPYR_12698 [Paratrimastix pyriformis]KAJ4453304.1 hypothetical protein PAPYR_12260 [Paratrimastix pyriformis]KAJ4453310.1 hypothetical protein PAPYR_12240 [Paratrimastix pyriformis]